MDTAWRIHSAIADWTGKVDAKASFALTVESAVLAGIVTLSGSGHRLHRLHGFWPLALYWAGIGVLALAVLGAVTVVTPRVRRRGLAAEAPDNFIYFGHLKHWNAQDLEQALLNRNVLPVLSRQLVHMSQIAWIKHQRVKASVIGAVIGAGLVMLAAWIR